MKVSRRETIESSSTSVLVDFGRNYQEFIFTALYFADVFEREAERLVLLNRSEEDKMEILKELALRLNPENKYLF